MSQPKVSVVIPTFNRPELLARTLASVMNQTFSNYEVIVIDDGSNTKRQNEQVVAYYADRGMAIRHFYQDNKGAPTARNRGIKQAVGDYIAFVDDDDEWLPQKLERQVELLGNRSESVGLVYTWAEIFDEEGNLLRKWHQHIRGRVLPQLLRECFVPSPSVMVRRECFEKVGLFDESFTGCQDWEMWTRIATKYEFDVVQDFLTRYHKHKSVSVGKSPKAIYGYYMYLTKFKSLYISEQMEEELSDFLSWVGYELAVRADVDKAKHCFKLSFIHKKRNWKLLLRYLDYRIFGCKILSRIHPFQ